MTFYERYAAIAEQQGLDPCSQKAADTFGLTRATISSWNTKKSTPKGETVARIADKFGVSADYLLGRTDDPTDFAKGKGPAKTVAFRRPDDVVQSLYARLDETDRLKVQGILQGLLMADKYASSMVDAAHVRTDTVVTDEMIAHDEQIMDDDDF